MNAKASTPAAVFSDLTSEEVSLRIYEAVLDQRLLPGTKLKEVPLATLFGVTRGTVRKAFADLASRRVIKLTPNRGASVAYPSVEESRDLFSARRTIEGAIVESLARSVTKTQLRRLRALINQEDMAYRAGKLREALRLSVDFHRVLATMSGNTVLAEMLDQLIARTPLVVLAYRDPAKPSACANQDHGRLLEALGDRDPERAVLQMRFHLCNLEGQLALRPVAPSDELTAIFGTQSRQAARSPVQRT